jgi:bifunctional DNA-binding transcriptional regulator/antitoxin component of YhaV-PrlF toxin-antitoxin module
MKTSTIKTSLDDAGRIQLPQAVQTQLGLKPGDELALREVNGHWFLKPIRRSVGVHDEDLSWEELEYDPAPLRRMGQAAVRIEQRGKLMPTAYDLHDE